MTELEWLYGKLVMDDGTTFNRVKYIFDFDSQDRGEIEIAPSKDNPLNGVREGSLCTLVKVDGGQVPIRLVERKGTNIRAQLVLRFGFGVLRN
jgi:hypothetical protein